MCASFVVFVIKNNGITNEARLRRHKKIELRKQIFGVVYFLFLFAQFSTMSNRSGHCNQALPLSI